MPDLTCTVERMFVAGDRGALHLRISGQLTGTFEGRQGHGQLIASIATDIYRVAHRRIEENLILLRPLDVVPNA